MTATTIADCPEPECDGRLARIPLCGTLVCEADKRHRFGPSEYRERDDIDWDGDIRDSWVRMVLDYE